MNSPEITTVITGGAGFIGTNLAHRLLQMGESVTIIDNLSRSGSEKNLQWLLKTHDSPRLKVKIADIRDSCEIEPYIVGATSVFHFAAQVAVTTSLLNPVEDFDINLRGTLNILEIIRLMKKPPFLLYTSTNKVYGKLAGLELMEQEIKYTPKDFRLSGGINEQQNLDFHSPYGCSKGGADQYIIDYARTYDLPATVFRMSCIYGPHQFGNEDQGWVAHFIFKILQNQMLTIYGNGKQVRDILYIDDLINAFLCARSHPDSCAAKAFTIGGGPLCAVSILEILDLLKELHGQIPKVEFTSWRLGDQLYYVSDTKKFEEYTNWKMSTDVKNGLSRLYFWARSVQSNSNHTVGEKVK